MSISRTLLAVLAAVMPFASCVYAGEEDSVSMNPFESLGDRLWGLPADFIEDTNSVFTRKDNLFALGVAGVVSIAMNQGADNEIDDELHERVFNHCTDMTFDLMGNPGTHFTATGIWYLIAAQSGNAIGQEHAWIMMRALSVNGFFTLALKLARDNDTPNGKPLAWPSGHTSSSFTVASVLDELYGPKVGIPAYIAATTVGLRMMDSGDHWASDVVFGAVLGYVVGHTVAGKEDLKVAGFDVVPITMAENNNSAMGASLYRRF